LKERRDRDLVGQRNSAYGGGGIEKNREGKFIKAVFMFSFAFKY